MSEGTKLVAGNKKAFHDYFIEDTFEAGIVLEGSEVKSVRQGRINLKDSYCLIKSGEVFLLNTHIAAYEKGSFYNPEERRTRKLLLKKTEINKLRAKIEQKGYTLVPTKAYFRQGLLKIEIGLARGKELHDKRRVLAEKDAKRETERILKNYK